MKQVLRGFTSGDKPQLQSKSIDFIRKNFLSELLPQIRVLFCLHYLDCIALAKIFISNTLVLRSNEKICYVIDRKGKIKNKNW